MVDLEKVAGIRLVIGDQKDPEDVGFVQWRSVFYVAGITEICSIMMLPIKPSHDKVKHWSVLHYRL